MKNNMARSGILQPHLNTGGYLVGVGPLEVNDSKECSNLAFVFLFASLRHHEQKLS